VHKPIYFVSKVLQGPEVRYQAIEKVALAVVFFSTKTSPLLPEFHRNSDDRPPHSQGLTEARCGRSNGALGS